MEINGALCPQPQSRGKALTASTMESVVFQTDSAPHPRIFYHDLHDGPNFPTLYAISGRQGNTLLFQRVAPAYFPSDRKSNNCGRLAEWFIHNSNQDPINPMKPKPTLALVVGAVLLAAITGIVKATPIPIDGNISFSGSCMTDDSNLEEAVRFMNFGTVTAGEGGTLFGDYAGTTGSAVVFKLLTRDPGGVSIPPKPLRSFVSGVDFLSPSSLVLPGFGRVSIFGPGLEKRETFDRWLLSGQTPGDSGFTFSSTTMVPRPATQNVPDGGATALLLGFSACGLGWLKRKSAA